MILKGDIVLDPKNDNELYIVNRDIPGETLVVADFFDPIGDNPKLSDPAILIFCRGRENSDIVEFYVKGSGWVY